MTDSAPTPNAMPGAQAPAAPPAAAPAPAAQPPAEGAPAAPAAPAAAAADGKPAPWTGEDFNPERAWQLVSNLRNEVETLKGKAAEAQPILDEHERQRREAQGELDTYREDLAKAVAAVNDWRDRAVRGHAHTAAAARFVDADAALALIGDLTGFATDAGIDDTKLTKALDKLAEAKPHLLATPAPQGMTPNRGQGQSGSGPLTPAQIAAHAESQQDWRAASTAKAQQLIALRTQA